MRNQRRARPQLPLDYGAHWAPGNPMAAAPYLAGPPGVPAVGCYFPPQQGTFLPPYQPLVNTYPIQCQPGRFPLLTQSGPVTWMPSPAPLPNCPPGLEYLAQLDNIHVHQHFQPLEMITGLQFNNSYDIKNGAEQLVYVVTEHTDDYTRNAYRTLRPFELRVTDGTGRAVMALSRPFRCSCCCFCCDWARQELEVQSPPGTTIGYVAELWDLCRAEYSLRDAQKEAVLRVRGPCTTYGCGSDSVFQVLSLDGVSPVGSITRKWNGLLSTMGNADHFHIRVPLDLSVTMKAVVLGACFLIDFMYFESSPRQPRSQTADQESDRQTD